MTLATSKNLTILGILTILGACTTAVTQYIQGGGLPGVNLEALVTAFGLGISMIMAKGAQSTGGTVPVTPEAAARLFAAAQAPKGFARLSLLVVLALAGCAGVSALQGSTGPIAITTGKDPTTGQVVATSSVTLTAGPAALVGGSCLKPVSATFTTLSGQTDACHVQVPLKPAADGSCP